MTGIAEAVAALARRQIVAKFAGDHQSPMVRVTCLKPDEIVSLVRSLRGWTPEGGSRVTVAVTTNRPWENLAPDEVVPRGDLTPTTLRNHREVGVVLIEGDDYTDRQSWQTVRPISDASLISTSPARRELVRHFWGASPPTVLTDVLELVHECVRGDRGQEELVAVRRWVSFVASVCEELGSTGALLDARNVWTAVGNHMPVAHLFPDDELPEATQIDRQRRLQKNRRFSYRLIFEADDHWRDGLLERAEAIEFARPNGDPEPTHVVTKIRAALHELLGTQGAEGQHNVPFRYWLQLVESKTKRRGVGSRIREHLSEEYPDRVQELDDLDVVDGIDAGQASAAAKLLNQVAEDPEAKPLSACLTQKQAAAIERLAHPSAPSTRAPLPELLRAVADMVSEREALTEDLGEGQVASISIEARRMRDEAAHSRAVFAWLFGPTLRAVAERSRDDLVSLQVAEELLDTSRLRDFQIDEPDEDDDIDGSFATLELRVRWSDGTGRSRRIDWNPMATPGLVALWRLAAAAESTCWEVGAGIDLDVWLASALERAPMEGKTSHEVRHDLVRSWVVRRGSALEELAAAGLNRSLVESYVDDFVGLLTRLRAEFVPSGAANPDVGDVLALDVFRGDASAAILATHPIRLRWIAKYLGHLEELICKALRSELHTNPVNPDLYFDELLSSSPQAQPPVAVLANQLQVAVREQDWHEVFAPLKDERGERRDWLADIDEGAVDDVADTLGRYLSAYPHKVDGLHILYVVRRGGARGLHRLVSYAKKRLGERGATLELTLCVDPAEIRAVEEVLQEFDDADHRAHSDRPPLQVNLRPWLDSEKSLPSLDGMAPVIDVAVVPNLFGASTRTHDGTRDRRGQTATFDPLLDEPTRLEALGSGDTASAAVSRVLLPDGRDDLLEAWSTVTTRQFRGSPVGEAPTETDVDHVTIQVSLERNRAFFDGLHACSHWVITVDGFVGREQIEALENGPDVIRVKTGVGANGAYRMVVSSKTGRGFVEARISRRLTQQVSGAALPNTSELASSIYDRARLLVPGIVLRSLGLGRTAAEMVGLVLARRRIEQSRPARVGAHGFQAWLSLDEHPGWSGGHNAPRADMARIIGWLDDERTLHLRVDVVEAKMRTQVAVGRADRQLTRSIDLLRAAFGFQSNTGEANYADVPMWRRLVWRAIEQTSTAVDGTPAATHVLTPDGARLGLDEELRAALRQRDLVVEGIDGILVSMVDTDTGSDAKTPAGYDWLRMTLEEARQELFQLTQAQELPLLGGIEGVAHANTPIQTRPNLADDVATADPSSKPPEDGSESRSTSPSASATSRGGASDTAKRRMQDLLDALHQRQVEVSPAGGADDALEGPGFYLLRLKLAANVRPQNIFALSDDLQYHLALDAGQVPRIYVDRGSLVVEIPKREEERYYIDADDLWSRTEWPKDSLYAPLGVDVRDRPLGVDFSSSRSPHLLIGGMTGGGKSVALETLLMGLVRNYEPSRLELRIIDPKGNEFTQFEDLPHVPEPPGMDAEDAIEMLEATCEEMDQRYRAMKQLSRSTKQRIRDIAGYNAAVQKEKRFKWLVVVLDEFADLTADKDHKKTIEALLQRIAQKARACGIHAIVATQKPSAEVISTTTRSNLGAQLALRVRSSTDSRVIMEATGAESLAGNGDAFLRLSGEEPIRLQCAKV